MTWLRSPDFEIGTLCDTRKEKFYFEHRSDVLFEFGDYTAPVVLQTVQEIVQSGKILNVSPR